MADHPLHGREARFETALHFVDPLVHFGDRHHRIDQTVEIDDLARRRFAHPHVVHMADWPETARDVRKRGGDGRDPVARRFPPVLAAGYTPCALTDGARSATTSSIRNVKAMSTFPIFIFIGSPLNDE